MANPANKNKPIAEALDVLNLVVNALILASKREAVLYKLWKHHASHIKVGGALKPEYERELANMCAEALGIEERV